MRDRLGLINRVTGSELITFWSVCGLLCKNRLKSYILAEILKGVGNNMFLLIHQLKF